MDNPRWNRDNYFETLLVNTLSVCTYVSMYAPRVQEELGEGIATLVKGSKCPMLGSFIAKISDGKPEIWGDFCYNKCNLTRQHKRHILYVYYTDQTGYDRL